MTVKAEYVVQIVIVSGKFPCTCVVLPRFLRAFT